MMLPPSSTPWIKCSTGAGVAGAAADIGAGVVAADTGVGGAADIGVGVVAEDIGAGAAAGDVRFQRALQRTGQAAEDGRPVLMSSAVQFLCRLQYKCQRAMIALRPRRAAFASRDFRRASAA